MTQQQFESVTKWQRKTFPKATAQSKVIHLSQELLELQGAIVLGREFETRLEIADCCILLMGIADMLGMTYSQLIAAVDEKMVINKMRTWGAPDADGVVNHLKNDEHE